MERRRYVNTHVVTVGKALLSEWVSLSETPLAYTKVADKVRKTSPTSLDDVWRQFYCAFHSVGRFEIQARIHFFVPHGRCGNCGVTSERGEGDAQED